MNQVPFKDAETWLQDHDETPDRKEFPKRFDRLYSVRGTTWVDVTSKSEPFRCALDLWHDYSKVIRNSCFRMRFVLTRMSGSLARCKSTRSCSWSLI